MRLGKLLAVLATVALSLTGTACATVSPELAALARVALQGNGSVAEEAAERLRQAGPVGMAAALALLDEGESAGGAALDRVCGVADCRDLRLFWYTDLDQAKAAAQAAGKPILSLRLLGRLDEELSCANSRFFRTALYPNRAIGELLREGFVLHWQSVRPVPKVTIDFGDGKTVQQTLTGNSLHYLLDSRGRLLDVLPGLYSPQTFERELLAAHDAVAAANRLDDAQFTGWAGRRYAAALKKIDADFSLPANVRSAAQAASSSAPGAPRGWRNVRGSITATKSRLELPLASALKLVFPDPEIDRMAAERRANVHLDEASRAFLLRKQGALDDQAGERLITSFEADLASDEVINQLRHRRPILAGLATGAPAPGTSSDLDGLTEWIYEAVLEDPISDPWMGLVRSDVYAALPMPSPASPLPSRSSELALPK